MPRQKAKGRTVVCYLAKAIIEAGRRKSFVKEISDSEKFGGEHEVPKKIIHMIQVLSRNYTTLRES